MSRRMGPTRTFGRRRVLGLCGGLTAGVILPACGLVDPPPPPRQFRLAPRPTFPDGLPQVSWSLVVNDPIAERPIDSMRIALLIDDTEYQYYEEADWADRLPLMAGAQMVQAFRDSGHIQVVTGELAGLRSDFVLQTNLRDFQIDRSGAEPEAAHVVLYVDLFRMPRRDVVGTTRLEGRAPIQGSGIDGVVHAFDAAFADVLTNLVSWTLLAGQQAVART
jgi:cholesterol transport system auxiliary component